MPQLSCPTFIVVDSLLGAFVFGEENVDRPGVCSL